MNITAHELRTPLTSVKASLQYLTRVETGSPKENARISFFLEKAMSQTNKLIRILNDLFEVSRVTTGTVQLDKSTFRIGEILQDTIASLKRTERRQVDVSGDKDADVYADKIKIEQVIGNILSNANKYSPPETPIVITIQDLGTVIEVRIKDFGVGIPSEKLPLVFERYFRVEETSKNYSGLGLGLFISKVLLNSMAGK